MIVTMKDGMLAVSGRVDSSNAAQMETELFALYSEGPAVIDAEKLEYISSAGLRVLMKLMRKAKDVTVKNASAEVYEILDITGFAEMMKVEKAMRFVSIEGLKLIGRGGNGSVYKLSDDMIIKTYHRINLEGIQKEREYGRNAFVAGVPCAIAFDVVRCEEGYGVIFEMAGEATLSQYLTDHPEKLQEYAVKYAQILKAMHTTTGDRSRYGSIAELFAKRAKAAEVHFTDEENALIREMLASIKDTDTMVHGDIHPGNVMVTADGELLFIDMADISVGNPLFDIGGACLTMLLMGQSNPQMTKKITGLDFEQSKQMFMTMVSVYYGTQDPQKIELIMKRLGAFALLRMATTLSGGTEDAKRLADKMVAMLRERLFPNAKGMCQLFAMEL